MVCSHIQVTFKSIGLNFRLESRACLGRISLLIFIEFSSFKWKFHGRRRSHEFPTKVPQKRRNGPKTRTRTEWKSMKFPKKPDQIQRNLSKKYTFWKGQDLDCKRASFESKSHKNLCKFKQKLWEKSI